MRNSDVRSLRCAGAAPLAPLLEMDESTFDLIMATNVKGVMFGLQARDPDLLACDHPVCDWRQPVADSLPPLEVTANRKLHIFILYVNEHQSFGVNKDSPDKRGPL